MNLPEPILNSAMDEDDDASGINPDYQDNVVAYAARIVEGGLFSADLVSNPSCNPSLFSQVMPDTTTPEEVPAAPEEVVVEEVTPLVETLETSVEPSVEVAPEVEPVVEEIEPVPADESLVSKEELEVKGPEGTQNVPEEVKEVKPEPKKEIPAAKELSRQWDAISTDLDASRTELSAVRSELSAIRSELEAAKGELSKRDSELVDLRYLHRSVLSVMGLSASVEIPEIENTESALSVIERYEAMPAGADRLTFFQANRTEIEKSISARVGK
jgi:flagellar motility protein MotE (MotC chaperone)